VNRESHMKIVIPGGSGQVGTILARAFHHGCHDVAVLSRQPQRSPWRVVAETFNHRSARSALQRSEREHAAPVMGEKELEQAAAQPADIVVEHQVNGFGVRWPLRV
jgi:predicted dinucleotide-binding enzyme